VLYLGHGAATTVVALPVGAATQAVHISQERHVTRACEVDVR
jgi:hypothetical protein